MTSKLLYICHKFNILSLNKINGLPPYYAGITEPASCVQRLQNPHPSPRPRLCHEPPSTLDLLQIEWCEHLLERHTISALERYLTFSLALYLAITTEPFVYPQIDRSIQRTVRQVSPAPPHRVRLTVLPSTAAAQLREKAK